MRRLCAAAILVLAACEGTVPPALTDDEKAAQRSFEDWRQAIITWQPEKIYRGMSVAMISDWLYQRIDDPEDPVMRKHRSQLQGTASDDLDVWYVTNKTGKRERASLLPNSVLATKWLFQCFEEHLKPFRERLKQEYQGVEVTAVYVDSLGATVVVRNKVFQGSDRYVMVFEGGWKIDEHIEPQGLMTK